MKKFAIVAAALTVVPSLAFAAPVFADSPGQLSNSPTNYEVKNVTKGGAYSQSTSAACGDTVKYSVLLANSDFGLLRNLTVKANLASGAINASATNTTNNTTSVNGSVSVSLANGSLVYVPGSTVRVTSNGATTTPLADGVAAAGVNAGDLNGSTQTFVQFQAKVDCPTTPTTPETPKSPEAPKVIASTGPTSTIAAMFGLGALTAGIGYFVQRRRNILG